MWGGLMPLDVVGCSVAVGGEVVRMMRGYDRAGDARTQHHRGTCAEGCVSVVG